jgi:hypothetical protein
MKLGRHSAKSQYIPNSDEQDEDKGPIQANRGMRSAVAPQPLVKPLHSSEKAKSTREMKGYGDPVEEARSKWSKAITASDSHFRRSNCRCHKRRYSKGVVIANMDPYEPCDRYLKLWEAEKAAAKAYFEALHASEAQRRAA